MPSWHFAAVYLPDSHVNGKQLKGKTSTLPFVAHLLPNSAQRAPAEVCLTEE